MNSSSQTTRCDWNNIPCDPLRYIVIPYLKDAEIARLSTVSRGFHVKIVGAHQLKMGNRFCNLIHVYFKAGLITHDEAEKLKRQIQLIKPILSIKDIGKLFSDSLSFLITELKNRGVSLQSIKQLEVSEESFAIKTDTWMLSFLFDHHLPLVKLLEIIKQYGTRYLPLIIHLFEKNELFKQELEQIPREAMEKFIIEIITRLLQEGERGRKAAVAFISILKDENDYYIFWGLKNILTACGNDFLKIFRVLVLVDHSLITAHFLNILKQVLEKNNKNEIFRFVKDYYIVFNGNNPLFESINEAAFYFYYDPILLLYLIDALPNEKSKLMLVNQMKFRPIGWMKENLKFLCELLIEKGNESIAFTIFKRVSSKDEYTDYLIKFSKKEGFSKTIGIIAELLDQESRKESYAILSEHLI